MIKKNSSCERFELGEKDEQEHQRGHQLRNNTNGTTKTSRKSLGEE